MSLFHQYNQGQYGQIKNWTVGGFGAIGFFYQTRNLVWNGIPKTALSVKEEILGARVNGAIGFSIQSLMANLFLITNHDDDNN